MDIMVLLNKVGLDLRMFMDETTFGKALSLLILIFVMYVYFTYTDKSEETR